MLKGWGTTMPPTGLFVFSNVIAKFSGAGSAGSVSFSSPCFRIRKFFARILIRIRFWIRIHLDSDPVQGFFAKMIFIRDAPDIRPDTWLDNYIFGQINL
jgi:hypothetical protein